jgi:hypothetical protein
MADDGLEEWLKRRSPWVELPNLWLPFVLNEEGLYILFFIVVRSFAQLKRTEGGGAAHWRVLSSLYPPQAYQLIAEQR